MAIPLAFWGSLIHDSASAIWAFFMSCWAIQETLQVNVHKANKIASKAELALRWNYIRDTENKAKKCERL